MPPKMYLKIISKFSIEKPNLSAKKRKAAAARYKIPME
jgi:hypothetical protein